MENRTKEKEIDSKVCYLYNTLRKCISHIIRLKGGRTLLAFDSFRMEEGVPIYLQIMRFVERSIAAGTARDQEELPSRRTLSAMLGVNPNTVQKAYRLLEEELMESRSGAKSVLTLDERKVRDVRTKLLEGEIAVLVAALKETGSSKEEALELVARLWDREGGEL